MNAEFDDCTFEGSPEKAMDRRLQFRPAPPMEAHLYPDLGADEASDETDLVEVSFNRQGVGLELPHDLPIGSVYNIALEISGQKLQSHVRVTSCNPIADGLYRVGGEFC